MYPVHHDHGARKATFTCCGTFFDLLGRLLAKRGGQALTPDYGSCDSTTLI
jgi:hypothetical protein